MGNGDCYGFPFPLGYAATLQKIGLEITTAGSAGAIVRLGIYADDNGIPGALLLDAGTIDATTTGNKDISISQVVSPPAFWLFMAIQGAPSTRPGFRYVNAGLGIMPVAYPLAAAVYGAIGVSGSVTGALPASINPTGHITYTPRIYVQVA